MMLSAEAIASVIETLKAADFYRPAHQRIFEAILAHLRARRAGRRDHHGRGAEAPRRRSRRSAARSYVYNLVESVPTPAQRRRTTRRIVADHALLRRLIDAASQIMARAYAIPEDPQAGGRRGRGADLRGRARRTRRKRSSPSATLVDESMVAARAHPSARVGVRRRPDRVPRPRQAPVRAAAGQPHRRRGPAGRRQVLVRHEPRPQRRRGRGHARRRRLAGPDVLPGDVALGDRHAAAVRRGARAVGQGPLRAASQTEDWTRIVEAAENLHDAPMFIVDSGNVTIVDIRAKARRLQVEPAGPRADHRRLPAADVRPPPLRQPPAGDRRDQPVAEAAGARSSRCR